MDRGHRGQPYAFAHLIGWEAVRRSSGKVEVSQKAAVPWGFQPGSDFSLPQASLLHQWAGYCGRR